MAKLPKKDQARLMRVIDQLERAHAYIMSDRTAVCHVESHATTTLHFTRKMDDRILYEVVKDIGSDYAMMETAISRLKEWLAEKS